MFIEGTLSGEYLAKVRGSDEAFGLFVASQRSAGVTMKAIAKKLQMSRQGLYSRLASIAEKSQGASRQTPPETEQPAEVEKSA